MIANSYKGLQSSSLVNPSIITNFSSNEIKESTSNQSKEAQKIAPHVPITTHSKVTTDGVYINPRAINTNRKPITLQAPVKESAEMRPEEFKWLLELKLTELGINGNRKT